MDIFSSLETFFSNSLERLKDRPLLEAHHLCPYELLVACTNPSEAVAKLGPLQNWAGSLSLSVQGVDDQIC
jgi:hypothetical protein